MGIKIMKGRMLPRLDGVASEVWLILMLLQVALRMKEPSKQTELMSCDPLDEYLLAYLAARRMARARLHAALRQSRQACELKISGTSGDGGAPG